MMEKILNYGAFRTCASFLPDLETCLLQGMVINCVENYTRILDPSQIFSPNAWGVEELSSDSMENGTMVWLPFAPSSSSNPVKILHMKGGINQKANGIIFIVGPSIFSILTMLAQKFGICDSQILAEGQLVEGCFLYSMEARIFWTSHKTLVKTGIKTEEIQFLHTVLSTMNSLHKLHCCVLGLSCMDFF